MNKYEILRIIIIIGLIFSICAVTIGAVNDNNKSQNNNEQLNLTENTLTNISGVKIVNLNIKQEVGGVKINFTNNSNVYNITRDGRWRRRGPRRSGREGPTSPGARRRHCGRRPVRPPEPAPGSSQGSRRAGRRPRPRPPAPPPGAGGTPGRSRGPPARRRAPSRRTPGDGGRPRRRRSPGR